MRLVLRYRRQVRAPRRLLRLSNSSARAVEGASAQANVVLGQGQVATDGTSVTTSGKIVSGSANAQISNTTIDNNANVGIGVKISIVRAEISVNLKKAVTQFTHIVSAIGVMIAPEMPRPPENIHQR